MNTATLAVYMYQVVPGKHTKPRAQNTKMVYYVH